MPVPSGVSNVRWSGIECKCVCINKQKCIEWGELRERERQVSTDPFISHTSPSPISQSSAPLCSYTAEVFWAVLHRKSFLKLKARSRAPEFAYIHALPTPYKGMLLQCVHTPPATRKQFQTDQIMSKQALVNPDLISPVQRWRYCCRM